MPILRIDRPLRVLLHLGNEYMRAKLNHLEATIAFTDQIFKLTDFLEIETTKIAKSGWKRRYTQVKKTI